jgi:hypothetical protein
VYGGENCREEFKYDIFEPYIVRTFVNATIYPHPAQQLEKKKAKELVGD